MRNKLEPFALAFYVNCYCARMASASGAGDSPEAGGKKDAASAAAVGKEALGLSYISPADRLFVKDDSAAALKAAIQSGDGVSALTLFASDDDVDVLIVKRQDYGSAFSLLTEIEGSLTGRCAVFVKRERGALRGASDGGDDVDIGSQVHFVSVGVDKENAAGGANQKTMRGGIRRSLCSTRLCTAHSHLS